MRNLTSVRKSRFDYVRMTGDQLRHALRDIDMQPAAFCRIFGVNGNVMGRWLKDEQDVPPWVYVTLRLLSAGPHMLAIAREAAAEHIRSDNDFPDRGEFPYRARRWEDSE